MSVEEGFQTKEETLQVFETVLPFSHKLEKCSYQKLIAQFHSGQVHNPLYL